MNLKEGEAQVFRHLCIGLLSAILFSGCSVVQPHPDLADTLRAVRITGGTTIDNPSRLILPQFAAVSVAHADGRVDHERLFAAQTGLAPYFSVTSGDAPWLLNVHWPDGAYRTDTQSGSDATYAAPSTATTAQSMPGRVAKQSLEGLKTAGKFVVRTADRDVLIVDVVQTANHALVTRLEVDIALWLRGRDWDDPLTLTEAFMAVGAALTGC